MRIIVCILIGLVAGVCFSHTSVKDCQTGAGIDATKIEGCWKICNAQDPGDNALCCTNSTYNDTANCMCWPQNPFSNSTKCKAQCEKQLTTDDGTCCGLPDYISGPHCTRVAWDAACENATAKDDPDCKSPAPAPKNFRAGTFFGGTLMGMLLMIGMILIYNVWLKRRMNNPGVRGY